MFTDHKTGKTKIDKNGRAPYVPCIAETIKSPDEIRLITGDYGDRELYFLSRFLIGRNAIGVLAVFAERGKMWEGWTGYQVPLPARQVYFETKREGTLIYLRPET